MKSKIYKTYKLNAVSGSRGVYVMFKVISINEECCEECLTRQGTHLQNTQGVSEESRSGHHYCKDQYVDTLE